MSTHLLSMLACLAGILADRGLGQVQRRTEMAKPHLVKLLAAAESRGLVGIEWRIEPTRWDGSYVIVAEVVGRDADGVVRGETIDLATVRGVIDDAVPEADTYAAARLAQMGGA